jgi:hypothetical protein
MPDVRKAANEERLGRCPSGRRARLPPAFVNVPCRYSRWPLFGRPIIGRFWVSTEGTNQWLAEERDVTVSELLRPLLARLVRKRRKEGK